MDEPWPLEVYGHDGKAVNVTMEPGDMVLVSFPYCTHLLRILDLLCLPRSVFSVRVAQRLARTSLSSQRPVHGQHFHSRKSTIRSQEVLSIAPHLTVSTGVSLNLWGIRYDTTQSKLGDWTMLMTSTETL